MMEQKLSSEMVSAQAGSATGPAPPTSVEETGLDLSFIIDLILKQVLLAGDFTLPAIAAITGLPVPVVDKAVEVLRRERLVGVKGTTEYQNTSFRFAITDLGRTRGNELMAVCRYTGPAPVTLEDYRRQAAAQSVREMPIFGEKVREAFAGLVLPDSLLVRLGPAIAAGKPILLYGPSGNGKTTISEAIGAMLPDTVFVPHALLVGGNIITVFDPVSHRRVAASEKMDRRWVPIRRPVIKTGGEFTLRMLDLEFNPVANLYEAPLQVKANHGLFIVDDFGRQKVEPQSLLNRWIVSLDRGVDFLNLKNGLKFDVPFDQQVIFSTNFEPRSLLDNGSLRRIRYKIRIDRPSEEDFGHIFENVCQQCQVPYDPAAFAYLQNHYYRRLGVPPDACHARDLLEQIVESAAYFGQPPRLTQEAIDAAWENYFLPAAKGAEMSDSSPRSVRQEYV